MKNLNLRIWPYGAARTVAIAAIALSLMHCASCRKVVRKELDKQGIQKAVVAWFADFFRGNDFQPTLQFTQYEEKEDRVVVRLLLSFPELSQVKRELTCEVQNTGQEWKIIKEPDL
ncbi:MAG TPA: hypothetical protein PL033_12700 [Candidatus Brocadiia bacterium]|nr:hypothetical protein [Candidatus Brocadiia bacterium]